MPEGPFCQIGAHIYKYTKQLVCLDMTKSKTNARGENIYIYRMGEHNTSPLKEKEIFYKKDFFYKFTVVQC